MHRGVLKNKVKELSTPGGMLDLNFPLICNEGAVRPLVHEPAALTLGLSNLVQREGHLTVGDVRLIAAVDHSQTFPCDFRRRGDELDDIGREHRM